MSIDASAECLDRWGRPEPSPGQAPGEAKEPVFGDGQGAPWCLMRSQEVRRYEPKERGRLRGSYFPARLRGSGDERGL